MHSVFSRKIAVLGILYDRIFTVLEFVCASAGDGGVQMSVDCEPTERFSSGSLFANLSECRYSLHEYLLSTYNSNIIISQSSCNLN